MSNFKPGDATQLIRILATINWRPLDANDHAAFADAGPDALISECNEVQHGQLAELFDFRAPAENGMMAIIGGDALQIELHSTSDEGNPIWVCIPISFEIND